MYIHSYIHTFIYTYVHSFIHTYIHIYICTFIHTYIHVHVLIIAKSDTSSFHFLVLYEDKSECSIGSLAMYLSARVLCVLCVLCVCVCVYYTIAIYILALVSSIFERTGIHTPTVHHFLNIHTHTHTHTPHLLHTHTRCTLVV